MKLRQGVQRTLCIVLALFMIFSGSIFQSAAVHADENIITSIAGPTPASFYIKQNVQAALSYMQSGYKIWSALS